LAHADLREEWLAALSEHPGSEVLAVQTLRNSLIAATMTAALRLMGAGHNISNKEVLYGKSKRVDARADRAGGDALAGPS
jgi:O-acetylhomoserine/O-acetylserine sulfhydrylase-like pyridoxal-dependent enzyme